MHIRALDTVRVGIMTAAGLIALIAVAPKDAVAQLPATPPAHYGPVSINMEDVEYPYTVEYLPLTMYGHDVRLAYMDEQPTAQPNGRAVVFFHGLNFFGEYWGDTMEALRGEGFRVIAVDQIGFGRSSKPIIPYTLGDMALNVRTLLEHLEIEEAAIVGHSMGGMLATRFAFFYPEVTTHLALVNQIGMTDSRLSRTPRRLDDSYQSNLERDYDAVRRNIERYYYEWDPAAEKFVWIHYGWTQSSEWPRLAMVRSLLSQMIYTEPIVYDWPHIQSKTLVIGGAEDGPDFPELATRVAESIPNAELHLIPEVGHNPHLEAPELFRPVLIEFLESEPIPRPGR
ncbi:MAG: alpha/beta hydrolase [Gemmatimonadota bacterium]